MKEKIIDWIRRQVRGAGAKGIVMGLSGGIDSCVVAALAKEALGGRNVLALFMPCHSHAQDLADALFVARKLGIKSAKIELTKIYDVFLKNLPAGPKMAQANLRPRLRMAALYYFANKHNYLVCGTGNKSELTMGYFTKYGDGGVDILPIASLLKRDVRRLAGELEIPRHIIEKPPTAGLWPGQTDEAEMGITYAELDDILERLDKNRKQSASSAKVARVKAMIKRSAHKRQGQKVCCI